VTYLGVDANNSAANSKDPVTPLDDGSFLCRDKIGHPVTPILDSASTSSYIGHPVNPAALDPNKSAGNSKDPVTPLGDGSPFLYGDNVEHPVNPSRVSASLPPYPFLSSHLSAIDATKVPASAARILLSIRKRKGGKMSADKWPDTCKELSQRFIEVVANRNMTEQEKKKQSATEEIKQEKKQQPGTEEEREGTETGGGKETLLGNVQKIPRRTSSRNIYSKFGYPPYVSPVFNERNLPTEDMVNETISHLCSSETLPKEYHAMLYLLVNKTLNKIFPYYVLNLSTERH
jgi:hypothetical protein